MATTKLVVCKGCNKEFEKLQKYVTAAEKKGRDHFCSFSCQMKFRNEKDQRFSHPENLRIGRQKDEFSDFRWILQRTKVRGAVNMNLEVIKEQWDKQNGICALSGLPMKLRAKGVSIFEQASLDRIDSSRPYEKDNIQFVVLSLNYAKSAAKNDEFLQFLSKLKMA